ncbi:ABC transporter ATP-binding protein/permease [Haloarcula sp. S1AR25-5A]|uniref:ABC transporter ATP-binding protein/permease n=1 Tax=Haloarcula terrestris TaxID=2950533 RepID=A0AAE4JIP4_9EURY|nr:ABC transporter ATP-binding protein [Haloarcula terrestris]MDS0222770.1 ABC transporter ATP-binding protein/permease [Haloarcula terrestris]
MAAHDDHETALDAHREQVSRPLLRLFRTYGTGEARWLALGLVASVLAYGTVLVTPLVLGTTIDAVFTSESAYTLPLVPDGWLPDKQSGQFWLSAVIVGTALGGGAILQWIRGVSMNYFAHGVMYTIRTDAYEKMQRLDMTFFDNKETGEVMSILNNDTSNLEVLFDNALGDSVRIGVIVLGITGALLYTNWQLALVTLGVVPLLVGFTWWFISVIEPKYTRHRSTIGDLNTRIENGLSGIELVKTTSTEAYENERVRGVSRDVFNAQMAVLRLSYFYRPGMEFITGAALLATFVIGGLWVFSGPPLFFSGRLTTGDFVVFMLLTQRLTGPMAQLSDIVDWYENAKASGKRICGLMDVPVRISDAPNSVSLDTVTGRVEYDDVTFAYETAQTENNGPSDRDPMAGEPVLDGVDITVAPGETTAIVGPTGAGKSTVAKLLLRLYDVTGGAVRVDGHDVRDIRLTDLRSSIGYVSQDTFLFDGTIAENIRYGRFDAPREDVVAAAKAAEAHEFIEGLSDGYDTRVGERGVMLSGGQRQRIAIARTVLQDPEILLLDEATSAVDTETEYLIQRSLNGLAADRTTLVIAHRLSTVKDADQIVVLDDGRVTERGTHEDLLSTDGLYANLWGVQAGEIDSLPDEFLARTSDSASGA